MSAASTVSLLKYVVTGDQGSAESLLKQEPGLLLLTGDTKDLSGRVWKNITALQLALWARDWHMWIMLLKFMKPEVALSQCEALEAKGTQHGASFNMEPFLTGCQSFSDRQWKYEEPCDDYWEEHVGARQKTFPVHVANEYCHPTRAFHPLPTFMETELPRSVKLKEYTFYEYDSSCGRGIYRARHPSALLVHGSEIWRAPEDALAVAKLWSTRERQYLELKTALKEQSNTASLQNLQLQGTSKNPGEGKESGSSKSPDSADMAKTQIDQTATAATSTTTVTATTAATATAT
jgi:hypothetical protein